MSSTEAVLLVADAGDDAGLGHIARSSALASALVELGIAVECVAYEASEPLRRDGVSWHPEGRSERIIALASQHRVVVVDSYRLSALSVASIASASRLAVMHDLGEPPPGAALTIAPGAPESTQPRLLAGLRYACLSPAFRDLRSRDPAAVVERVLVTTGGGDPGRRGSELAAAAASALPDAGVQLVRGPQAPIEAPSAVEAVGPFESMAGPLAEADLAVTGAGGTLLEACAAGVPALGIVLASNQAPLAAALAHAGAVSLLDDEADLAAQIQALAGALEKRRQQSRAARATVDGRGASRVAFAVEQLLTR